MEIIEEAIRTIKIIPTEEVDDWLCEIRHGNEDPLVALLLLHAPKIHSLPLQFFEIHVPSQNDPARGRAKVYCQPVYIAPEKHRDMLRRGVGKP